MSDEESTPTEHEESAIDQGEDQGKDQSEGEREVSSGVTGATMLTYAQWAAFALLLLVALIATVRLYFAASATIDTFVTHRFRPVFMAGFNLAVLLSCGLGLSALVRRLA
jgi:hypothetical protein